MKENQVQLFHNGNMSLFCDSFSCFNKASWFIGRPDGPYNLFTNLCDSCKDSLVTSIIIEHKDYLMNMIEKIETDDAIERDKEMYGGKEFVCKVCGTVFYSPTALATHTKVEHPKKKDDKDD